MKTGDLVKWYDRYNKIFVTGEIVKIIRPNGVQRAIVAHKKKPFKHYFDIEIGCFALELVS